MVLEMPATTAYAVLAISIMHVAFKFASLICKRVAGTTFGARAIHTFFIL